YEYYFNTRDDGKNANPNDNKEVKTTDSGRTVYGGGGITPDVKVETPKPDKFQTHLYQKYAFFNFAKHFLSGHKIDQHFEVNDEAIQEFRKFLEKEKVEYTEPDLTANMDWLKSNIKSELFTAAFGQEEGMRVLRETDPEVAKALALLPQAKALNDGAHKIIADRNGARNGIN